MPRGVWVRFPSPAQKENQRWFSFCVRASARLSRYPIPKSLSSWKGLAVFRKALKPCKQRGSKIHLAPSQLRLRYARKSVSFFESGNPSVFANDVCISLFGSYLAEIVQVSRPFFLKLSATKCVPWLHGGVFCDFCNKLEVS